MCLTLTKPEGLSKGILNRQISPKPTKVRCTALQRDEIQLHQPEEHRHKLPQPGKHHRTLIQPHQWGQTPQPRRTTILRTFFFPYESHCLFPLHTSIFTLPFCSAVEFSSLFFLFKKHLFKIFFTNFVIFVILFLIYLTAFLKLLYQL